MDKSLYDMVEECANCTDKALQKYLLQQIRIRIYGGYEDNFKEKYKVKERNIKK